MKFFSVIGTRPNFVKEFLINKECRKRGYNEILIHTGQHYDYEMSQVFFDGFDLPVPDHYLAIENKTAAQFSGEAIVRLDDLITEDRPDFVLGYGDVNSTLSAAVAATKNHIPFAHVEGGIRGHDLYNPEEINRRVSDVLAEVIYCCTRTDIDNLRREGYDDGRIVLTGDLMNDAFMHTLKTHGIEAARGDYLVLTLHRQENVLSPARMEGIIDGLVSSGRRIVFPAHPRTRNVLEKTGLIKKLVGSNVEIIKPLGYIEFTKLLAGADKVLTDSGGVRREAYLMRKPCIVLIELSWFPEISQAGWKILTGPDPSTIAHLINNFEPTGEHRQLFGDGTAHLKILDDLEMRYG